MPKETLGLKCGAVSLVEPSREDWEAAVDQAAADWKSVLGTSVVEVEEVGSSGVQNPRVSVHSKPIVDVMVAVTSLDEVTDVIPELEAKGYAHHGKRDTEQQQFFLKKIKMVSVPITFMWLRYGSEARNSLRNFRDYLTVNTDKLRKYDALKQELAEKYSNDRHGYNRGKAKFVQNIVSEANDYFVLGKTVTVTVTDPIGPGCRSIMAIRKN